MYEAKKIPLIFRVTGSNRFTVPVLLNALERGRWNSLFDIRLAHTFKDMLRMVGRRPAVAAFSFMTPHIPEVSREIARLRRKTGSRAVIVAGGPHPTGDPEGTLRLGFDAVLCGEGETGLPLLLEAVLNGTCVGRILRAPRLTDLDDSFPISKIDTLVPPLEITRGCFHNCAFCQTRGREPLYRSAESVERFLDELVRLDYVFRTGFICPSGFEYGCDRAGKSPVEALARLLASAKARGIRYLEYGIFPSEVRPDTVSHETVDLVKKYCSNRKITLGAQSASDPVLKREKRGHSAESIERAASLIRGHGLRPQIDYILGFPDETEEDQVVTLQQMERLSVRYGAWNQVHYFLPLAGTPQFRQKSAPISPKIVRLLEKWSKNGYASNWWKQGVKTAHNLERFKQSGIDAS